MAHDDSPDHTAPRKSLLPPPRRGTFVDDDILESRFGDLSRPLIAQLLAAELERLTPLEARRDLALGILLDALVRRGGVQDLGHARRKDFAPSRLGFSWGHGLEVIRVAKALHSLPILRAAFLAGSIPRTKLRLIVGVATPETEAGWLALASRRSSRGIAEAVRAFERGKSSAPESDLDPTTTPEYETVTLRLQPEQLAAWHWGRAAGRVILGDDGPDWKILEAMAAEAIATHGLDTDDPTPTPPKVPGTPAVLRPLTEADLAFLARDQRTTFSDPAEPILPVGLDLDTVGIVDIYRLILSIIAERRGLHFERARLLSRIDGRRLYRELGALSMMDFATRRLGMAPRDVRESLSLQSDLMMLPELSGAWRSGQISSDVAAMLARVVSQHTEGAWLAHAERAPLKRLEFEVDFHLAMQSVMTWQEYLELTDGLPQGDIPTETLLLDWQAFFGLRGAEEFPPNDLAPDADCQVRGAADQCPDADCQVRGAAEPDPSPAAPDFNAPELADPPMLLAELRAREVRGRALTFRMPREAAVVFRAALRSVMRTLGLSEHDEGAAFHQMLVAFIREHAQLEAVPAIMRRHRIFSRDGWTCRMPHCRARGPFEAHHVEFRSAGGSDEDWNRITDCVGDHRLTHLGKQIVTGRSDALVVHIPALGETYRNGLLEAA